MQQYNQKEIGARIKSRRKEMKVNQKAFATLMGISQPEVSNIEHGKRSFSQERLEQIASHLSTTADALANGPAKVVVPAPVAATG